MGGCVSISPNQQLFQEELAKHFQTIDDISFDKIALFKQHCIEKLNLNKSQERVSAIEIAPEGTLYELSSTAEKPTILPTNNNKTIVLFCDGTSDDFASKKPTNIVNLYQIIESNLQKRQQDQQQETTPFNGSTNDYHNKKYLLKYFEGVATEKNSTASLVDGLTAYSLNSELKEILIFLQKNYQEKDELIVFGFSRGSFLVRILCNFLRMHGIRKQLKDQEDASSWFDQLIAAFQTISLNFAKDSEQNIPQQTDLENYWLPVFSFVGLFDTVVGVQLSVKKTYDYFFHVDDKTPIIQSSCHIMSTDTTLFFQNTSFYWNDAQYHGVNACLENAPENLDEIVYRKESYIEFRYPGGHGNIGGGWVSSPKEEKCLSNNTLRIMLKASPFAPFLEDVEKEQIYPVVLPSEIKKYIRSALNEHDMKGNEFHCDLYQFCQKKFPQGLIPHRNVEVDFACQATQSPGALFEQITEYQE